jgi:hypothetical protein
MKQLAGTALVACLVGCATPRTDRLGSVTVMQRHGYAICGGYCPNLDVVVREDGLVTLPRRDPRHLRVSVKQAAQFVRILSPYRPAMRKAGPATCEFQNTTDPLVVKVHPYEITWTDADGSTSGCGPAVTLALVRQSSRHFGRLAFTGAASHDDDQCPPGSFADLRSGKGRRQTLGSERVESRRYERW